MDYFAEFGISLNFLFWIAITIFLGIYIFSNKRKYNLPPGPRGLPIIGSLPFLGDNPHLELTKWSKQYGGIFGVYMGTRYVVVVTDVTPAKELLNKPSTVNRPPHFFQFIPGGVGFEELSGPEWVEQRRYTIMQLKNLGVGKSHFEKLVQMDVSDLLNLLEEQQGQPVDICDALSASVSNNILSLVTNRRIPMGDPGRNIVDNGVESFESLHNPSGMIIYFPKLFKLFVDIGLLNLRQQMKDMINLNKYISHEIEELKQDKEGHSFIQNYLIEVEKNKRLNLGNSFNDANLLGNVQALITAGSDTSRVSLLWLYLIMAAFPEIQKKVHEEIDKVIGRDGSVDWADRQKLKYCLATTFEGQRWRTVVPLNLLHRTSEDIVINGYDIPKETDILTVFWAIHNDPKYWKNPDVFQPERFLSEDGKTAKELDYFMPFSYGKRVCPGKTVALIELFHYFVSVMQRFRVLPASDTQVLDFDGLPGLTLQPKRQPLRFVLR